eukprot:m.153103 g.153103  ORF g.153103 m.153103 type:complete len:55 (-) comp10171_c8_seq2:294-458(-)
MQLFPDPWLGSAQMTGDLDINEQRTMMETFDKDEDLEDMFDEEGGAPPAGSPPS